MYQNREVIFRAVRTEFETHELLLPAALSVKEAKLVAVLN
jgi:hypothetical protein